MLNRDPHHLPPSFTHVPVNNNRYSGAHLTHNITIINYTNCIGRCANNIINFIPRTTPLDIVVVQSHGVGVGDSVCVVTKLTGVGRARGRRWLGPTEMSNMQIMFKFQLTMPKFMVIALLRRQRYISEFELWYHAVSSARAFWVRARRSDSENVWNFVAGCRRKLTGVPGWRTVLFELYLGGVFWSIWCVEPSNWTYLMENRGWNCPNKFIRAVFVRCKHLASPIRNKL